MIGPCATLDVESCRLAAFFFSLSAARKATIASDGWCLFVKGNIRASSKLR
jgi:hypothetical protein